MNKTTSFALHASVLVLALAPWLYGSSMLRCDAYANIYSSTTETINCEARGTYYPIITWEVQTETGIDGQTDGDVVTTIAGTYKVSLTASFDGQNAHEYDICLFLDGAEVLALESQNTAKSATGKSVTAGMCLVVCTAGQTLDARIADLSGTGNCHINRAGMVVERIAP
jgi:hypothetical protein